MTFPLTPTVIVINLNAADGAARNPASQATVPINLAELEHKPFPRRRPTPSLRTALDRQRHLRTNRPPLTLANRVRTSIAGTPPPLSP